MPNHVTNKLTATGPEADTKNIFISLKSEASDFDFNQIMPMPEELKNTVSSSAEPTNDALIEKYGYDNWYNWSNANWGTKWNAYDVEHISDTEVQFDTAWSCADTLIAKLSALHPTVELVLTYADEDTGSNCGIITYNNGEITNYEDKSMGNLDSDEESIRWAMTVKYGSDEDYEEWYESDEEDED